MSLVGHHEGTPTAEGVSQLSEALSFSSKNLERPAVFVGHFVVEIQFFGGSNCARALAELALKTNRFMLGILSCEAISVGNMLNHHRPAIPQGVLNEVTVL